MSGNVVTRTTVGLLKRNCYSYSNFTIPHPPTAGAPFTQRGLDLSAIADIYGDTVHLRPCSLPRDLSTTLEMTGLSTVPLGFIML